MKALTPLGTLRDRHGPGEQRRGGLAPTRAHYPCSFCASGPGSAALLLPGPACGGFTFLAERRKARKITPSKAPVLSSAPDLSAGRGKALPPPPPFLQRVQGHQGRTHPSGCGHPPDHQRRGGWRYCPPAPAQPRALAPTPAGKGALPCRDRQVGGGLARPGPQGFSSTAPFSEAPFPRGPPATRVRATEDT